MACCLTTPSHFLKQFWLRWESSDDLRVVSQIIPEFPEFQGFRVWGKFVFQTLGLMATPTNLAYQVKVGHALD